MQVDAKSKKLYGKLAAIGLFLLQLSFSPLILIDEGG
jgi:hypothetical protein